MLQQYNQQNQKLASQAKINKTPDSVSKRLQQLEFSNRVRRKNLEKEIRKKMKYRQLNKSQTQRSVNISNSINIDFERSSQLIAQKSEADQQVPHEAAHSVHHSHNKSQQPPQSGRTANIRPELASNLSVNQIVSNFSPDKNASPEYPELRANTRRQEAYQRLPHIQIRKVAQFMPHRHSVNCLRIRGDELISASDDYSIAVWNTRTNHLTQQIQRAHQRQVKCLALNLQSNQLLSGGADCLVKLHDSRSLDYLSYYRGHGGRVNSLHIFDFSMFASASGDGRIIIWDTEFQKQLNCYDGEFASGVSKITGMGASNPFHLVAGAQDSSIKIFDIRI